MVDHVAEVNRAASSACQPPFELPVTLLLHQEDGGDVVALLLSGAENIPNIPETSRNQRNGPERATKHTGLYLKINMRNYV